jgi:hypothetical protein
MLFNIKVIDEKYALAMSGDNEAILTLVEWSLMIISKDFNLASSDASVTEGNKAFAECAYALNMAMHSLSKQHKPMIKEHAASIVEIIDQQNWTLHLPIGQLRILPVELIGVLYQNIFKFFKGTITDE